MLVLVTAGCGQVWLPSEKSVYRVACDAIQADPNQPAEVSLARIEQVKFFVNKGTARVDIPCQYQSANGQTANDTYVVWLRRVARTWTFDRLYRVVSLPESQ